MNINQKTFLLVTIIGGLGVILSYILGVRFGKGADALWGGVPQNIRGVYTISMLISAVSYMIFSFYVFLNLGKNSFDNAFRGVMLVFVSYILLLICSALWLPLVNVMVANPKQLIWILIRGTLLITGIASVVITYLLVSAGSKSPNLHYYLSVIGGIIFSVHTLVLDGLFWPSWWGDK